MFRIHGVLYYSQDKHKTCLTFVAPLLVHQVNAANVTVNGKTFRLPRGMTAKKAKEVLKFELPLDGGFSVWVDVTRIESLNWVHKEVYGQVLGGLRCRSRYQNDGQLTWGENFGPFINKMVDQLRVHVAKRDLIVSQIKKVKKHKTKVSELKKILKPLDKHVKKIEALLKAKS